MTLLQTIKQLAASAPFWSLFLPVIGAFMVSAGVGLAVGFPYGLIVGGLFCVAYGVTILKGLKNG